MGVIVLEVEANLLPVVFCFLVYIILLRLFGVHIVHCRRFSFVAMGLNLCAMHRPLLCVCVTLRLLGSSIFNWIVWCVFPSLIMVEENILVGLSGDELSWLRISFVL